MADSAFVLGLSPVARYDAGVYDAAVRSLVRYLSAALALPVRPVSLPGYEAQLAAMREGALDAAVLGAYASSPARAEAGAEALAVSIEEGAAEISTYQSVIIARADSAIRALPDLRGRTVGLVDPGSTAGYLLPRLLLGEAGLDPDTAIIPRFLQAHAAVREAVLAGEVDAGGLHRLAVARIGDSDNPQARTLRVIATSPQVPRGPFAVRRDLPREPRQRLLQALLRIHEAAPDGARLLLPPGMRCRPASSRDVTLKTVAALAGVSYGTVSRVVNGGARVAPETRARVADVVRELGYRPNPTAVGLIADRSVRQPADLRPLPRPAAAGDRRLRALGPQGTPARRPARLPPAGGASAGASPRAPTPTSPARPRPRRAEPRRPARCAPSIGYDGPWAGRTGRDSGRPAPREGAA